MSSPDEHLDVYDESETYLGTAPRHEVHRLGLWHRTFHCWVVRPDRSGPYVLVQQRHARKDTNPNRFDVTVAGHLRAGEGMSAGTREIAEEIGLSVRFDELIPIGEYKEAYDDGRGLRDYEIWTVFLYLSHVPLEVYRPAPDEVAGLFEAKLDDLLALFRGRRASVQMCGVVWPQAGHDIPRSGEHELDVPDRRQSVCTWDETTAADGVGHPQSGLRRVTVSATRADFVPRPPEYYSDVLTRIATYACSPDCGTPEGR